MCLRGHVSALHSKAYSRQICAMYMAQGNAVWRYSLWKDCLRAFHGHRQSLRPGGWEPDCSWPGKGRALDDGGTCRGPCCCCWRGGGTAAVREAARMEHVFDAFLSSISQLWVFLVPGISKAGNRVTLSVTRNCLSYRYLITWFTKACPAAGPTNSKHRSPPRGHPAPSVGVAWPVLSWGSMHHTSLCRADLPQYSRAVHFHPQVQKRLRCELGVQNGKPKARLLRTVWKIDLLKVCYLDNPNTITPHIKQKCMRQQSRKHMDCVHQIRL